jgi:hypothetical protein
MQNSHEIHNNCVKSGTKPAAAAAASTPGVVADVCTCLCERLSLMEQVQQLRDHLQKQQLNTSVSGTRAVPADASIERSHGHRTAAVAAAADCPPGSTAWDPG